MTADELKAFSLTMPGSREDFPFDEETSVFKVGGKMFALSHLAGNPLRISLKCDPDFAEHLRRTHPAIIPGWFKRHWNTITIDGSLSDEMLRDLIRDSYDLVVAGLPRGQRAELAKSDS